MPRLELSFLGYFQVKLDSQPVTTFEADKGRAGGERFRDSLGGRGNHDPRAGSGVCEVRVHYIISYMAFA
jgi:hypothetical protein